MKTNLSLKKQQSSLNRGGVYKVTIYPFSEQNCQIQSITSVHESSDIKHQSIKCQAQNLGLQSLHSNVHM